MFQKYSDGRIQQEIQLYSYRDVFGSKIAKAKIDENQTKMSLELSFWILRCFVDVLHALE